MLKKNWKKQIPRSLRHSMELGIEHAKVKLNRSVEGVAEVMGLENHWSLYKWAENGRMPAVLIPAFEAACGCDYVSRWLATRGGRLLIDVPTGRKLTATDVAELQTKLHSVVGELMKFYAGECDAGSTLAAITHSMESLAWHRGNIEQHNQPQLELGSDE